MGYQQARSGIERERRQSPVLRDQGGDSEPDLDVCADHLVETRPQRIKKQQPVRRSRRLQDKSQSHCQTSPQSDPIREVQALPSPLPSAESRSAQQISQILPGPPVAPLKRKRGQEQQEVRHLSPRPQDELFSKRPRTPHPSGTAEVELQEIKRREESASDVKQEDVDPVGYWILSQRWPKEFFEQPSQVWEDLEQDSSLEEQMENPAPSIKYVEVNGFRLPCPIRKVPTSVRRRQSDSSLNTSSDQKNREKKSAPYRTTQYTTLLERKGSYLREFDVKNIPSDMENLCETLLEKEQTVPQDSLFSKDLFQTTCQKIEDRNEARVIQDIARLIVPSAETLATYGATHLDNLIEGVNETWTGNIAVEGPLPKPDYSVGFGRSAFTDAQLKKLDPLIGTVFETSLFVATYRMYFPFLTCEVKCGAAALDIADRQNAHSMTVAVRALVELFRSVKREKELNQEILAFSISHDYSSVRIYGHYPIFEGDKISFYRHPIHKFDFTALDGRDKWTAYKFTKNVYEEWLPKQFARICSAIESLPADINFDVSQSASVSQSTPQSLQALDIESTPGAEDSQSSLPDPQEVTPITEPAFKKSRNQ